LQQPFSKKDPYPTIKRNLDGTYEVDDTKLEYPPEKDFVSDAQNYTLDTYQSMKRTFLPQFFNPPPVTTELASTEHPQLLGARTIDSLMPVRV
jgi:hypothetical protein